MNRTDLIQNVSSYYQETTDLTTYSEQKEYPNNLKEES